MGFLECFFCIRVTLYVGIMCNLLGFQHGSDGFLVRLFQTNFKRKAADTKRLTQENMGGCSEIHSQLSVQSLTSLLEIAIHTKVEIGCGGHEISAFVVVYWYCRRNEKESQ